MSKISLLPYTREEVFSMQEAKQKMGWEITSFNLPETWKSTQGEGVTVAVLDTGADLDHEDLVCNLLQGKNFVDRKASPNDDQGHGSHVTGTICACNNDSGMVGVAPKAKVIPVKVLDRHGTGQLKDVADGIYWAADQGVDFITMSLGSPSPVGEVHKAIKYANEKKVVVWCAAGNAGRTHNIFYPAAYPETIGIGAIDKNFERANFSCTGPDLDFLAPGVGILSTVPDNWYAVLSGTSMANPFAVGLGCLLLSYKREKNLNLNLETNKDYIDFLKGHTIFKGDQLLEGFGIIDPRKMQNWLNSNS